MDQDYKGGYNWQLDHLPGGHIWSWLHPPFSMQNRGCKPVKKTLLTQLQVCLISTRTPQKPTYPTDCKGKSCFPGNLKKPCYLHSIIRAFSLKKATKSAALHIILYQINASHHNTSHHFPSFQPGLRRTFHRLDVLRCGLHLLCMFRGTAQRLQGLWSFITSIAAQRLTEKDIQLHGNPTYPPNKYGLIKGLLTIGFP